MSKLIDKLNQATKAVPQPMGFRAVQPSPARLKPLLIASLTQPSSVTGADAVLITKFSEPSRKLPKPFPAFPGACARRISAREELNQW